MAESFIEMIGLHSSANSMGAEIMGLDTPATNMPAVGNMDSQAAPKQRLDLNQ